MTLHENTVTSETLRQRDHIPLRRWIWVVCAFVLFAISVTGMVVRMPYVAFLPGDAFETESRMAIECAGEACLDTFPSDGEIFFTTVSVRQKPSFWEYLWLRADDDVEIDDIENVLGERTTEENDQLNADLMTQSKDVAVAVALEQLGYDAINVGAMFVAATIDGTAADGVLEVGDRLVAIDGQQITSSEDLFMILSDVKPNTEIDLSYARSLNGSEVVEEVTLELGANPDDVTRPFIGIQPIDQLEFVDFDFDIDIDSAEVGGPSAGLAFALATLDYLTEGDLTGGDDVAVTGTIAADGSVGPIGGVLQKSAAVRDLGIGLFIVPASLPEAELQELERQSNSDFKIVPVNNIEEALAALEDYGGDVDAVRNFDSADL